MVPCWTDGGGGAAGRDAGTDLAGKVLHMAVVAMASHFPTSILHLFFSKRTPPLLVAEMGPSESPFPQSPL